MSEQHGHIPAVMADDEARQQRDRSFARMFQQDDLVWQVSEAYNAVEDTWRVDFLRADKQGTWLKQRYIYDVATSVIYFFGARPVPASELRSLRRAGHKLPIAALLADSPADAPS